ncbi:probable ion channel SYM8 isoform X2 [Vicia villosa]|uniref:probable ion channel SYM8 isoform X2 n=1 Tax=Vicia villosa TaxID=3911 RepID=UPI00273C693D|nr:probable ion channel SYM8 isoform X2 [Vicia villosa]
MAKSNEEPPNSNLSINKPPLKKTKTLSSLNLRVSVAADNGIGNSSSSSSTKTDFEQQQWNYPSFLGIGSTSRKRRPPPPPKPSNLKPPASASDFQTKPHSEPKTSSSSSSPSSIAVTKQQQQQHSISSPVFYLFIITCVIFVPYSAYLQYKLAKLKDMKLQLCCQIDFCSGNGKTSLQKDVVDDVDDGSFSYNILNADSRTISLYIVLFTLVLPFVLYKYIDYLPQMINFLRRTNGNKEDVPLKKRVAYNVDVFFSIYPYAKLLALLFATLFLIAFGGLALYAVTGGSMAEALWHSWTYVADAGNHAETEGMGQRIVSVSVSAGGMLIFAMMLGLVSDAISEKVDSLRKGKSEVIERNHVLILGWSDKLGSLLKQLAIANKSVGGGVIVVLAEKEKEEMEMDIAKLEFDFMGTSVICRSGSPLILADLKKVSVSKARAIIVLASDENADQSDARALRVVLSLTGVKEGLRGHVVVEMSDLDNEPLVKLVGGELIETVVAHDVIGRLMIQCALQPGLAQIWEDILGFENAEFYIKRWLELDGLVFKDILISFPDAIPCGVKVAADGGKIVINPDDNYVLRDGDEVLVIAEDDDTYAPGSLPEVRKGYFPRLRDPPKYPEKILFCGWRRDIDDMIMVLEAFLAPGSELWMFNEVPEKERERKLAAGELDVFGLENIKLVHREGNAVIRRHLESLPLETFDSMSQWRILSLIPTQDP